MANSQAIAEVGKCIERFLSRRFADHPPIPERATRAVLVRTEDFEQRNRPTGSALSLFLYRVELNNTMRAAWSAAASHDQQVHVPLDLHYLLTPWDANVEDEHRILGRTIQCLETPSLSGPLLGPTADWAANESLQIVMEDLSTEDIMRTFDSLPIDYKLSVPYVARVVRIDGQVIERHSEVTAAETRITSRRDAAESMP